MYRSLRFQLIAIAVVAIALGLTASHWLGTRLSERALERDLMDRALAVLRTVGWLWEEDFDTGHLRLHLESLVANRRQISAIDFFQVRRGVAEMAVTTREEDGATERTLTPEQLAALTATSSTVTLQAGDKGVPGWRIAMPLRRGDTVVAVAQVEVRPTTLAELKRSLRRKTAALLLCSFLLTSIVLATFLERRVARPVAALVSGIQKAERGDLEARVAIPGGGEFGFLAGSLNRMLSRLQDLTANLEARVQEGTHELSARNRELQIVNEKLSYAQLELARSERLAAVGQMAATIAHQLGTPLNSVLGYTQLLLHAEASPTRAAKLRVIESQVQRVIDTIRGVLERTRGRAASREPVAVAELVDDVLALASPRLDSRHLTAKREIPAKVPTVLGDVNGLRQVLLSLLDNAIDATGQGGVITVSAAAAPGDESRGSLIEVAVQDTGQGMTPDEVQRVFDPFYTTKPPGRGTGLGLVIADEIVRDHGGRIVIESKPGRGTTVRVQLPLES